LRLANWIERKSGSFSVETTSGLGDPTYTVFISNAATFQMYNHTGALNKIIQANDGGTIFAHSGDNVIGGNVNINANVTGATINTGGARTPDATSPRPTATLTISGVLGGLNGAGDIVTKLGPGKLTLSNPANTFTGTVQLNEGAMVRNGLLPGNVTMASGATLAGTGTVGGTLTDANLAVISPGGSIGTLTFNNYTTAGGGQLNMDLTAPGTGTPVGNDLIAITNNLTLNGTTTAMINPLVPTLPNGSYTLMTLANPALGGGGIAVGGLPLDSRKTYNINVNPTDVVLAVGGTDPVDLKWVGNGGSNVWDIKGVYTGGNYWLKGATPDQFYTYDRVTFDDSTANRTVNLWSSDVKPGSITVDTANTYTFNGNGLYKITGSTGLTKSGTGTLILNNPNNDYTGTTTINAGILQVGDGGTSNAQLGTGVIVNNGQLILNQTDLNHTVPGTISGSGSIEQKGTGIVTLSGDNTTYDGTILVSSGTLQAGSNSALGSTVGGTTITSVGSNAGTLDVNGKNLGAEAITVQGQGVYGPSGPGAITNNSTAGQNNALRFVTLTGDTTFGGGSRWDIRTDTPATVPASLTGNGYNLTKEGTNQVYLANLGNVDLGNVNVNYGDLGVQGTTTFVDGSTSDLAKPITVASGAMLTLWSLPATNVINKKLTLQGGTLQATTGTGTTNTYGGEITLNPSAGGTISTATGTAITVTGNIVGSGANLTLTKSGTAGGGTVTLTGANTYSGTTYLNDGTLIVTGSLTGGITMQTGVVRTTLSGTGTINGPVADAGSTIIAPGATAATGAVGTLTFLSSLTFNGTGQINMDLSNNPAGVNNDLINVGGLLSLNGTTTVLVNATNGFLGMGTYHLIHYTGTPLSGSAANLSLSGIPDNTRQSYGLSSATLHDIDLIVSGTPPASLVWAGGLNGNAWDVKTTTNWSGSDSLFWNADQVTFDNTGSITPAVNIGGIVLPSAITVDSSNDYTFSGTGKISGGGALTKRGSGTLTVSTSNDFTGVTTITGGTLKVGIAGALGSGTGGTTISNGGTLDVNGINLTAEPITASGAGVGGNGAIINMGVQQTSAVTNVTLTDDTTFGGTHTVYNSTVNNSGRWDIRGTSATLSTGGHSYNLIKNGNNQIGLVAVTVDPALGNITINGGSLSFQTSTNSMGDPTKALTINSGGILGLYSLVAVTSKVTEINGGTIWAENGSGTQNTFSGAITIDAAGGTFDAGGVLGGGDPAAPHNTAVMTLSGPIAGVGGVTKSGPGTVFITGVTNYNGDTVISEGTLQINTLSTTGSPVLHNVSGTGTLGVGDGTNATNLTVDSINLPTLTLGIGSRLTIAPLPGGLTAGTSSLTSVPEPSTWAMLMLAAMGLGMYWRRSR
jgi:autotransporter-associated beta strand protein